MLLPALAFPVLSYRTIVGDGGANAASASAELAVPPLPEVPMLDMREERASALLERPLFSPSRRPVASTLGASPDDDSSGPSLLGIASGAGRTIALIRTQTNAPPIKAQAGEAVAGWQLVSIETSMVVLERQQDRRALDLPFGAPAPALAPEVAAPEPDPGSAGLDARQQQHQDDSY
jgi:hypothetical protein